MEDTDKIKMFETELGYIQDDKIREQCEKVLKAVNDKFFVEPASSTGKYHPNYALGEGGLVRHTKAAVKIAQDLLQLNVFNNSCYKDYIITTLILHDTCKSGKQWEGKYSKHEHPLLAKELIEDTLTDDDDKEFVSIVSRLVASHMGQWTTTKYSQIILPEPVEPEECFVHMCDYLASRKYLEVIFDETQN